MADRVTSTRLVFHVGGYDPRSPERVHRRFVQELRRFEATWSVKAVASEPIITADEARWNLLTEGPNWRVKTDYRLVRWDDLIESSERGSLWRRIPRGVHAFTDFLAGGALGAYLRTNWRYAGFFLYPVVLLAVLVAVAVLVGVFVGRVSGVASAGILVGVAAFAGLIHWPGRWLHLPLLFDDWNFSRAYIKALDPVLDRRLERIAHEVVAAARDLRAEEIVLVGHSLGAVLAVDILDRALSLYPALGRSDTRVVLLSVGSSILKIGLHRGASRFRAALQRVANAEGVVWGEYQALTDVMNFYKTNPVACLGLATERSPVVRVVRIRRMLEPAAYRRIRRNFFRVHCQFVRANDCRTSYDYFMFLCGPLPAAVQIHSPTGAMSAIGSDGCLLDINSGEASFLERAERAAH
ncbi:hypothetical protein [Microvirga puerhi]|uniref:Alpha/beta hydrolase n=1 Tax=Microvirga puerhi TaxID=2876078 RepID=A0ABS7VUH0_9HYPH|nr:hypothetical protein [Microvirga puerhi]MBZ6079205.1 hypothetical protein [Microvirga puerhi]